MEQLMEDRLVEAEMGTEATDAAMGAHDGSKVKDWQEGLGETF